MRFRLALPPALLFAGLLVAFQPPGDDDDPPPEGVEVQARGPVHEGFAEATKFRGEPGAIVAKEPPAPIEEMPPEERPEGDNVSWIPGYWSWDDEAGEFLWVSGFWRDEPPGRDWVPGEWQRVAEGYQWVSGYWAPENQEEAEYLPPPPPSLDRGPSTPAPAADSVYVPGNWVFQETRYFWAPGYWIKHNPGWVWSPACYKWTPGGYIFVRGFWDRPLADRGLLFAPVRFTSRVFARRDFVYRPSFVVQPDFLVGSLFVRSTTRKYYFGDYFETGYREKFIPWMDYRVNKVNPDLNYSYYRASFARQGDWDRNLRALYTARYKGEVPRPPRTLVQQRKVVNNIVVNKTVNNVVNKSINITNVQNVTAVQSIRKAKNVQVTNLASLASSRVDVSKKEVVQKREVRIQKVKQEQLQVEKKQVERYRAVSKERMTREVALAKKGPPAKLTAPVKVKVDLPRTVPPPRVRKKVDVPPPPAQPRPATPPPPAKKGPPPPPKKKDGPPPPAKRVDPTPPPAKRADPPPPPAKKADPPPPPPRKVDPPPPPAKKADPPPPPPKKKDRPREKDKD